MSDATQVTLQVRALRASAPDRDFIVISHPIDRQLHIALSEILASQRQHDKCTVFLTTWGGDPDGGYRAARCLRHYYKHVRLAIPSFCKSAGTLIAIAADELAIGDLGELGPLDIQVRKSSELQERSSGLDIMQALQAVTLHTQDSFHRLLLGTRGFGLSTKICAEFAATVASGIAAPLIGQIDPIRLGEMQRATRVALEYGQRLDAYAHNLKEGALERLIGEYPAHGFVIDRKEAGELFNRVEHLSDAEKEFCSFVWSDVARQSEIISFLDIPNEAETGTTNELSQQSASAPEAAAGIDNAQQADCPAELHVVGPQPNSAEADGQGVSVRSTRVGQAAA